MGNIKKNLFCTITVVHCLNIFFTSIELIVSVLEYDLESSFYLFYFYTFEILLCTVPCIIYIRDIKYVKFHNEFWSSFMDRVHDFIFNESFSVIFSLVGYFAYINMALKIENEKWILAIFLFIILILLPIISYRKIIWSVDGLISDKKEEKAKQDKNREFKRKHVSNSNKKRIRRGTRG
ncbi:hypothetical protein R4B61_01340 [Fructilactobacillus vespulae]|uniref:hypothetical protein n=1 Tax=Fructilactobacillus vespulae TaxID=1249630 RepID=UPI0039B42B56